MKKILLSTPVFKPMVGGMETMANNLAIHFTNRGYKVTLVTPIPAKEPDEAIYDIVRHPSPRKFLRLAKATDVIFCNGASLYPAPYAVLANKPVIVRHTNYVVSSLDGAGWFNGKPAPLRPLPSIIHHLRHGKLLPTLRGILKIGLLRLFVKRFAAKNVAISNWMRQRHPLPNDTRIYNPFPIGKFIEATNKTGVYEYDFFFLGRLITEKGIDVLIKAFGEVQRRSNDQYKLCIIGDGPERGNLERLSGAVGQGENVHFAGMQTGKDLIELVRSCQVAVLPSTWEEPFGGASTELLAAGKNIIVSRDGALSELIAEAGLSFPNGDVAALGEAMLRLITDGELQARQREIALERVKIFDEEDLISQYVELIEQVMADRV